MVVKDRTLGTNDCRGWISLSVFERFHLPGHRLYQFRLAFENTQAKGACKVMPDDVAQKLGADIILPESCVKPEYKQSTRFLDFLHWRRPKIEVDRKSTRLNSSHLGISYAVFCLKKKKKK